VKPTTSQLSINKGPDPEITKPVDKTEEITALGEEDINQDQAEEPATPEAEATITGMANTAIFAKFRATDRKNAAKG
jgi:hypothetical protein